MEQMKVNTFLSNTLAALVIVAGLFAVSYYVIGPFTKQHLRNEAVNGCIEASMTKIGNADSSTWESPNKDWFNLCMENKGYTVAKSK